MNLSDVIVVDRKFVRSINLERDKSDVDVLKNYEITSKAREIITRFVQDDNLSAWSLVGPYGMGKSAFFHFLLSIAGPDSSNYTRVGLDKLKSIDQHLYRGFMDKKSSVAKLDGFFRIPVVASFESVNLTLARGLYQAVQQSQFAGKDRISAELSGWIQHSAKDAAVLLGLFKDVAHTTGLPLMIVLDELGKNLEYLAYNYHDGDLFILQQLAEMDRVFIWVSLHQSFQEYLPGFSVAQQQEWNKVQGRFEEVSFVESATQVLNFIGSVVKQKANIEYKRRVRKWAENIKKTLKDASVTENGYFANVRMIEELYPFHPVTSLSLVALCRRYAQNERTLVSFLSSSHRLALPEILKSTPAIADQQLRSIGLDVLYNYFFEFGITSLSHIARTQRWIEIRDIIEASSQHTEEEGILIRNIGVLNLLAGSLGLKASPEILFSVMEFSHGWPDHKTETIANSLVRSGTVFYREYANEWRLWEGSDFDVSGAICEEKAKLTLGSLEALLEQNLPLSPMIAAKHSIETGVVRKFERRWVDGESLVNNTEWAPHQGFDGLLLYCFGITKGLPISASLECEDERPLLLVYSPIKETLSEMATEVIACQKVLEQYSQMTHDKVARKEVMFRHESAMKRFREFTQKAFVPAGEGLEFHDGENQGQLYSRRALTRKISDLCDIAYGACPKIANEIISGERLSGIAVRSRREVVEAMTTSADEQNLGLSGLGPEVAIYRSLILAKGLHRYDASLDSWFLTLECGDPGLSKLWDELDNLLELADSQGMTIQNLVDELRRPPFGLKEGPSLLYISLYLLVKSENLIVFCDNVYRPYLSKADMALLLKRPDLFTVKMFLVEASHIKVFEVYRETFDLNVKQVDSSLRNATMLGVVGPLMKFMDELPRYSKRTKTVSIKAERTRMAIMRAVDPLHFLFDELPEALGIGAMRTAGDQELHIEEFQVGLRSVLAELSNAFAKLLRNIERILLAQFVFQDFEMFYTEQTERANRLLQFCTSTQLKPVLMAMARQEDDLDVWIQGIAGAIVEKPVDSWDDDDLQIFEIRLVDFIDQIDQVAILSKASFSKSNAHVISMMAPGGKMHREIFQIDNSNQEVLDRVEEIMGMPAQHRSAVLALLANKIIVGDSDA